MIQARNINLSTFPYEVLGGTTEQKSCASVAATNFSITLPQTVSNTNYYVAVTLVSGGSGWGDGFMWKVIDKTTSSFKIQVWNPRSSSISSVGFNWVLVHKLQ